MLHIWLIPALVVLLVVLTVLYLVVRLTGGSGARTDGRTLVDDSAAEPDPYRDER